MSARFLTSPLSGVIDKYGIFLVTDSDTVQPRDTASMTVRDPGRLGHAGR